MKQKHLLRHSTWLKSLLLMVVMAISGSVYAQDATFNLTNGSGGNSVLTEGNIKVTYNGYNFGANIWGNNYASYSLYVDALNGESISKIEFEVYQQGYSYGTVIERDNNGSFSYNPSGTSVWTGEASSLAFVGTGTDTDAYVTELRVWLAAPAEPVTYTVNIVDAPEGASVTLDGKPMNSGDTYEVAKKLTTDNLSASEPAGYYAEKSYNEATHTFTVTYKQYFVYTVHLSGNPMGALIYNGEYYESGQTIQAKTTLTDSDVELYDLKGYDESVRIDGTDIYGTYTESAQVNYTVTITGAPEGAVVSVYGTDFTTSGTLQTNYTLDESNVYVNCPTGYEYNVAYDEGTHTFTVTFQKVEYIEFITSGISGTYNYETGFYEYQATTEPVTISGCVYSSKLNLYSGYAPIVVSSTAGNIVKIVFNDGQSGIYANANCGTYSNSNGTWEGTAQSVSFTTSGDYYISSIKVYLAPAVPTDYTFNFVGAPEGTTVTIDGTSYTANDTYHSPYALTNIEVTNDDYNTVATIEEGDVIKVVFSRYEYAVTLNGAPEGATITIGGQTYGNGDTYCTKNAITEADIDAAYEGYETEVTVSEGAITVTYTKAMSKTFSIASTAGADNKYWTTFCYNHDFTLPEGFTACKVTAVGDSELTIEEFEPSVSAGGNDYYNLFSGDIDYNVTGDGNPGTYVATHNSGNTMVTMNSAHYDFYGYVLYPDYASTYTVATTNGANITKVVVTKYNYNVGDYLPTDYVLETPATSYEVYCDNETTAIEVYYEGGAGKVVIPANTGILICADEPTATPAEITPVTGATPVDMTGNLLWGCLEDQTKDAGSDYIYKLSLNAANDEGSIGFYWGYAGGHKVDAHAGKAYLVLSAQGAKANGFRLDGTTTGIESLIQGTESAPVFNLSGQRMNTTNLPAGIYVKNGRKFIVK